MRDIRSDLQERATLVNEQIRTTCAQFEKTVEQLRNERDARVADLKSGLETIAKFMEFEQRCLGNVVALPVPPPLSALADRFRAS
jgi:hypothetical protein